MTFQFKFNTRHLDLEEELNSFKKTAPGAKGAESKSPNVLTGAGSFPSPLPLPATFFTKFFHWGQYKTRILSSRITHRQRARSRYCASNARHSWVRDKRSERMSPPPPRVPTQVGAIGPRPRFA